MNTFLCSIAGAVCLSTAVMAAMGLMAAPVVIVACGLGAVAWFVAPYALRRR